MPKPGTLLKNTLKISVGDEIKQHKLLHWLTERGFNRVSRVEAPGEYSMCGGIMDVFPESSDLPIRIELFGDTVESLRIFSPDTQTSLRQLKDVNILALREESSPIEEDGSLLDYLPSEAWVVLREPAQIEERAIRSTPVRPQTQPQSRPDD
ncbi:MAG: hypothetical protein ACE5KK_04325, partial [Candidatus Brocadiales bacterium]